jgi:hypothetical protein
MPSRNPPWLAVKLWGLFHTLPPLAGALWLATLLMTRPPVHSSPGGWGDVAGLVMFAGAIVLGVVAVPYLIATIGVFRRRRWAAMMMFVLAALQGGLESLSVVRVLYFSFFAAASIYRRGHIAAPPLFFAGVVVIHVMLLARTMIAAWRAFAWRSAAEQPHGFGVVATEPRHPAPPPTPPVRALPIAPPSSQFRADNHYDPLST